MAKEPKIEITAEIEEGLPELTDAQKSVNRAQRAIEHGKARDAVIAQLAALDAAFAAKEEHLRKNGA